MSRFAEPQDPLFQALNRSLDVDRRLWPYDIAQSRAHASMLAARQIISDEDRDALLLALEEVEIELAEGRFPFPAMFSDPESAPRVGDGFIRLDTEGRVVYASPNALSVFRRLGLIVFSPCL